VLLCLAGTFIKGRLNLEFGALPGGFLVFFPFCRNFLPFLTFPTLYLEIGLAGALSYLLSRQGNGAQW
jgi:hypothetical protein